MKTSIASVKNISNQTGLNPDLFASNFVSIVRNIWQNSLNFLSGNTEIRISKLMNQHGNTYWEVYDPAVRQKITFGSEAEVRQWLEQRYYQ